MGIHLADDALAHNAKRQRTVPQERETTAVEPIPMVQMHPTEGEENEEPKTEMEAVCFKCFDMGTRRLVAMKLAYHPREFVVEHFECPACGYYTTEVLTMETVPAPTELETDEEPAVTTPITYQLKVQSARDLDRRILKAVNGTLAFEEIEFEIPAASQRGEVDTLGGFIRRAIKELSPNMRDESVSGEVRTAIETTVTQLVGYLEGNQPFTVRIDDRQGDSFIEHFEQVDSAITAGYARPA